MVFATFNVLFAKADEKEKKALLSYADGSSINYEYAKSVFDDNYEYQFVLSEGETVVYNEPIDLRGLGTNTPFASIRVTSDGTVISPVQKLALTLTDAYDSTNFITLTAIHYEDSSYTYFTAGSSEQPQIGYEAWNDQLHIDDGYGYPINISLRGTTAENSLLNAYFDLDSKSYNAYGAGNVLRKIMALDDTNFYGTPWQGFTTGEVYLSITIQKLNSAASQAKMSLVEAGNNKLDGYTQIEDTVGPEIIIEEGVNALHDGALGYPFYTYSAKGYDSWSGIIDTKVEVYRGYKTENQEQVAVVDGYFSPAKSGVYTMVYKATDDSGNTTVKEIAANIKNQPEKLMYTVLEEGKTQAVVGEKVEIAKIAFEGGEGNVETAITVKNKQNGKFYSIKSAEFFPEEEGEYEVVMAARDAIKQKAVYKYVVNIFKSEAPVITMRDAMPYSFISGLTYTLPYATAYDYKNGCSVPVEISVNGEKIADRKFKVASDCTFIDIIYSAKGDIIAEKAFKVKVLSSDTASKTNVKLENYFTLNNATSTLSAQNLAFNVLEGGSVEFNNNISAIASKIIFNASVKTDLILSDVENNRTITLTFNGDKVIYLGKTYKFALKEGNVELQVDSYASVVTLGETLFSLTEFDDGVDFTGFSYNYFRMKAICAEQGSFNLFEINKQKFNTSIVKDSTRPAIQLIGDIGGNFLCGDMYEIYGAAAYDTLDSGYYAYLSVYDPDGKAVEDINGTVLEYLPISTNTKLILNKLGNYKVTYTVTSNLTGGDYVEYFIRVVDTEAPEISIKGNPPKTYKVGDYLVHPTLNIFDNFTKESNLDVYYMVFGEDKLLCLSTEDAYYKFEKSGAYTVCVVVEDQAGNIAYESFKVNVK